MFDVKAFESITVADLEEFGAMNETLTNMKKALEEGDTLCVMTKPGCGVMGFVSSKDVAGLVIGVVTDGLTPYVDFVIRPLDAMTEALEKFLELAQPHLDRVKKSMN